MDLTGATGWPLAHPAVQIAVMGASSMYQVEAIASYVDVVLPEAAQAEEIADAGAPVGGPSPEEGVPA